MTIPFVAPLEVTYGIADQVSPLVRRVVAENPSPYTYLGTGTYVVGRDEVAVVDPGPELESHRKALAAALDGERVGAILVTHCHADHSSLAAWLQEETGAPTYAFGPHPPLPPGARADTDGAGEGDGGGLMVEEAIDRAFVPDVSLADGAVLEGPGWTIRAVHTPGHTSNHLCYALVEERALFTGDHVMGWSTSVVVPPDGDMRQYLGSLEKLLGRDDAVYWPTHGGPILDPAPFVRAYVAHRLDREAQVTGALRRGLDAIPAIVADLYADVRRELHEAAAQSVLAHLVKLAAEGVVVATDDPPRLTSTYRLAPGS